MAYIDLNYLKTITDGDQEMMQEMEDLFISQVPEFIENLNRYLKEKQYIELGKEAHKAKSSVMIMGMEELGKDLKSLQQATIAGTNEDMYPHYVKKFELQCMGAVKELKRESSPSV